MSDSNPITLAHSGKVYETIIRDIIDANPIVAVKALQIAHSEGNPETAIKEQLAHWGDLGIGKQTEAALRTLVDYYQRKAAQQ